MKITRTVKKILDNYESDNPGTKGNLARILMHGRLGGSGKMVILPVDQGFEHGPARSFAPNPDAYDPHYHYQLAVDAGLNAYAAPLGPLEAGADSFAGAIPTILKVNSANSLSTNKDQAVTASVRDALRLGCSAIGFTIYPGSEDQYEMMEEIREMSLEAKSVGLAVVMWSYPRGGKLDKAGETALDVCAYSAHMAALLGAHIIKVKLPTAHLEQAAAKKVYESTQIPIKTLAERVKHVVQSSFDGRRIVIFSGGAKSEDKNVFEEARAIREGGGFGNGGNGVCFADAKHGWAVGYHGTPRNGWISRPGSSELSQRCGNAVKVSVPRADHGIPRPTGRTGRAETTGAIGTMERTNGQQRARRLGLTVGATVALLATIATAAPAGAVNAIAAIGKTILDDVVRFEAGTETADDQTLLVARWRGPA